MQPTLPGMRKKREFKLKVDVVAENAFLIAENKILLQRLEHMDNRERALYLALEVERGRGFWGRLVRLFS